MERIKIIKKNVGDLHLLKKQMAGLKLEPLDKMFYYPSINDYIKYWKKLK